MKHRILERVFLRRWSRRLVFAAGLACAFFAASALFSQDADLPAAAYSGEEAAGGEKTVGPLVPEGEPPDLVLFATGDVAGHLEPCGCPVTPIGGLDRRAGYALEFRKRFPDAPFLWVDSGALFGALDAEEGRMRTETLVEAYNRLNYAAVNIAYLDVSQDFAFFERMREKASFPFITSSWRDASTRKTLGDMPHAAVSFGDGKSIAFLGLQHRADLTVTLPDGRTAEVADPVKAARNVFSRLRKEHDLVVALVRMDEPNARELARAVPRLDLIIASMGAKIGKEPLFEEEVPIVYTGYEGRTLAEVRLFLNDKGRKERLELKLHPLSERYLPEQDIELLVLDTLDKIAQKEAEKGVSSSELMRRITSDVPTPKSYKAFAGSEACKPCHARQFAQWEDTPHARAFEKAAQDFNPQCVACHATGYKKGGFRNMRSTPEFAGVGCESCHGAASEHAADPKKPSPPSGSSASGGCEGCHNKFQDPDFNRAADLEKIRH
jgi:2',3'-cyclic-nucleotide 2'-phosphodiesterase (5'-nucleotidase family)